MAIPKKIREEIEVFICMGMDILDKTGTNSDYWKEEFAKMSDTKFEQLLKKKIPLLFQVRTFEIEPTMEEFQKCADYLKIPLLEKLNLPYFYKNKDGVPVNTKECLKMYIHFKKMQQFLTNKNHISIDIDKRDNKTGKLLNEDKSAAMSDREIEALAVMELEATTKEFTTIKADAINAKAQANNMISTFGYLSQDEYEVEHTDSISRNTINAYLLAAHIESNLILNNGYTPYTLSEKERAISRED